MPVSIKDIARLAGVSHSTVSRALNNNPLIPSETRERIQRIAAKEGYTADIVARSLVTRKTNAIGVVVTSIADPFNGEIVEGIEEAANHEGYSVVLATSQTNPKREMEVVRSFRERRVDGILVASSRLGAQYSEVFADLSEPIVLLNNQHPGEFAYSVSIDNEDGAFQATQHLLSLGHKDIGYIGDESGLQSDTERFNGFQRAFKKSGVKLPQHFVLMGNGKADGGKRCAGELLDMASKPTAIFCYNDMTALGAIEAIRARGLSVPENISIVGFDDLFFTASLNPALTTFHQPKRELGREAMNLLIAVLKRRAPQRKTLIKGELVVRASTAALLG